MQQKINFKKIPWMPLLDVLAISAWGILMLKYWLTGKLNLLIHPDYQWLVILAGFSFLCIGISKGLEIYKIYQKHQLYQLTPQVMHFTLFPPGWSSTLLLIIAIIGIIIKPQVFTSQTALQLGVSDVIGMTRSQPQSFRSAKPPEQRSLLEWVRTLHAYPDPDRYTGQKVKVQGFVIHTPTLSDEYMLISRFVITCCAADAYPVGLTVKLPQSRNNFKPDTWLEIEGNMITENLQNKRQLVILATNFKPIEQPENPYEY